MTLIVTEIFGNSHPITKCPRCGRKIEVDSGHDGEGSVNYCCEYAFYSSRVWQLEITDDNRESYARSVEGSRKE